jgi:hypothetical protein
MAEKESKKGIQIYFPDALKGGVYSNVMQVAHTKEEFVLDFMMVMPPVGSITSRVIISPGHVKRMLAALADNIKKYEDKYGKITAAEEPIKPAMGFHPQAP